MTYEDVKGLSVPEIIKKKKEVKASLFEARMKNAMGQMNDPISIRKMRRQIARLNMAQATNLKSGAKL